MFCCKDVYEYLKQKEGGSASVAEMMTVLETPDETAVRSAIDFLRRVHRINIVNTPPRGSTRFQLEPGKWLMKRRTRS